LSWRSAINRYILYGDHLLEILKKILKYTVVLLFCLNFISQAFAESQTGFFYYLLPPQSEILINENTIFNEQEIGKMMYKKEESENLQVDMGKRGVKIIGKWYRTDVRENTRLEISENVKLQTGSIHVVNREKNTELKTIYLDDLKVDFKTADFIAFVAGDHSQKIIKVLEGEIEIKNEETTQKILLQQQYMTSANESGEILNPIPFDLNTTSSWWTDDDYIYEHEMLPIAHAGVDQRVPGNIPVVLNGSASEFKTGDIFVWTLVKGPQDENANEVEEVVFDSTNIVKPLFSPEVDGEYRFSLQITNEKGEKSNVDTVTVYVGKRYLRPISIFSDVSIEHPNNIAITYLYKKDVMVGSEDKESGMTLFRPDQILNRVEILKVVFKNKKQKIPSQEDLRSLQEPIFEDVSPDHWFAPYVYLAKQQNLIEGNNGFYRSSEDVLLVEALKIIVKANQINIDQYNSDEKPYPDVLVGAWYIPYLNFAKTYNLIDPDENGEIHPGEPLTRAQFAEIIYRMDSINLFEQRGFLYGYVLEKKSQEGIENAEIYIYKVLDNSESENKDDVEEFYRKGDLFFQTNTQTDGSFSVSLPIGIKYYIEAKKEENVSTNNIITELEEDVDTQIELEIEIHEEE
jgi:hypothetical protein